jgi:hypothetical protein
VERQDFQLVIAEESVWGDTPEALLAAQLENAEPSAGDDIRVVPLGSLPVG